MVKLAIKDPRLSYVTGGTSTVSLQLIKYMLLQNIEVHIVTKSPIANRQLLGILSETPIKVHEVAMPEPDSADFTDLLYYEGGLPCTATDKETMEAVAFSNKTARLFAENAFDLVIASFPLELMALPPGQKCVLHVNGLPPNQEVALKERPYFDRAGLILCASQFVRSRVLQLYGIDDSKKLVVAYQGIPTDFYDRGNPQLKKYDVCYIGRLQQRKGLFELIDAIDILQASNPKIAAIIVGDGDLKPELERIVQEKQLTANIQFAGSKTILEVRDILDQSRTFAYPVNKPEALGLSPVEAMARGLVVVSTGLGGLSEYMTNNVNCMLVQPSFPEDLAAAIERSFEDIAFSSYLIQSARSTANQFRADRLYPEIIKQYLTYLKK